MISSGTVANRLHVLLACAVNDGFGQLVQQDVRFAIQHAVALLNGGLADGLGQVTFPGAAGARETSASSRLANEGAGGQIEDQAAIHLRVEGEVEVVQGSVRVAKAGLLCAAAPAAGHCAG